VVNARESAQTRTFLCLSCGQHFFIDQKHSTYTPGESSVIFTLITEAAQMLISPLSHISKLVTCNASVTVSATQCFLSEITKTDEQNDAASGQKIPVVNIIISGSHISGDQINDLIACAENAARPKYILENLDKKFLVSAYCRLSLIISVD
jgi:hypothetical protein